uniref:Membrane protein n=1 Tax=Marseillevirus sp. TaxID=2809551 RepID=A0AA96ESJ9_9VIRU|nr:membrane protein [Marseillevirus sp.]
MRALFLWLFLLLVVEVVVLYSMKKYAHSPRKESVFLVITLIGYATLGYLIVKILELQEYMGLFFVFRNIIIAIMAVGIGLFVFGEKVSPKQVFGIVLGIASLFLIA